VVDDHRVDALAAGELGHLVERPDGLGLPGQIGGRVVLLHVLELPRERPGHEEHDQGGREHHPFRAAPGG
jgi:hypothetical protein